MIYFGNNRIFEKYDAKISNNNFNDCLTTCKNYANCSAIAYDALKRVCYLSKEPIDDLYINEYNKGEQKICNKMTPPYGLNPSTLSDIRQNATFICLDKKNQISNNINPVEFYLITKKDIKFARNLTKLYEYPDELDITSTLDNYKYPTENKQMK